MNTLGTYKPQIDQNIRAYCDQLLVQTEADYGPYSREAIETYCSLLSRGGKRLRGSVAMAAYQMAGGSNMAMMRDAARIIEMLNANLLLFDDIADLSGTRRGGPTVHRMFEKYHRSAKLFGDSQHFGVAMALHVGIAGTYLVAMEIAKLQVDDAAKLAATANLNKAIYTTVHGQFNDIANEAVRLVNQRQVERTLTWKAAYYTLLQPLQFGLLLAGSKDAELPVVRDYAMNLGLAFQIIDDILGTFGDATTGKSNREDLTEGKITLLVSHVLQHGNAEQKKTLLAALGNKKLTDVQYEAVKEVFVRTGAVNAARDAATMRANAAVQSLRTAPNHWTPEGLAFLRDLAAFVVQRKV